MAISAENYKILETALNQYETYCYRQYYRNLINQKTKEYYKTRLNAIQQARKEIENDKNIYNEENERKDRQAVYRTYRH